MQPTAHTPTSTRIPVPDSYRFNVQQLLQLGEKLESPDYNPLIPDAVTSELLARHGVRVSDKRSLRFISIAVQKLIHDVVRTAEVLQSTESTRGRRKAQRTDYSSNFAVDGKGSSRGRRSRGNTSSVVDLSSTVSVDSVTQSLHHHGFDVVKPPYHKITET
ncbi:hypothetical protein PCE1_001314 [Barthelona sp. PCE]